ncbi:MAG: hypothetical protein EAZ24_08145 [Burkholderiales bacterium]|nr:MAG: hypothetical protein EAZ24_08145 [Burkholderiales bacterium]TAG77937.1 MAG: hypothetical protein EAZ21_13805 [Betaproteobacteria bacterium]
MSLNNYPSLIASRGLEPIAASKTLTMAPLLLAFLDFALDLNPQGALRWTLNQRLPRGLRGWGDTLNRPLGTKFGGFPSEKSPPRRQAHETFARSRATCR